MTFGYSSQVLERVNISGIPQWAKNLLDQVVAVRKSVSVSGHCGSGVGPTIRRHTADVVKERVRPIIFVCHSLGGIVAREVSPPIV